MLVGLMGVSASIVVKELRQAFAGRWVVGALLSFLTLQVVILGAYLMLTEQAFEDGTVSMNAGRHMFSVLQAILLSTCMLLAPAYAGLRLGAERNDANVDLLFISTLTPRAISASGTISLGLSRRAGK
ncbi:MAG: hypothetical protein AB7K24_17485 [Gemmataceae bacterium]